MMRPVICAGLLLASVLVMACTEPNEGAGKVTVDELGPVVERHSDELMKTPGVTGVAVGALGDGTLCILILVQEDTKEIRSRLPSDIEGHPVQIMVTGTIEPLNTDSSS